MLLFVKYKGEVGYIPVCLVRCLQGYLPFWSRIKRQIIIFLSLFKKFYYIFLFCVFKYTYYKMTEKAMATTPVLLPGKSHGRRSLVGCSPWGCEELDMTWATSLSLFTFMHWRKNWQPTPVFLPGESQGRGSLVGCRLWGRTESDTTEVT